jgi:hypothetical protein
MITRGGKSTDFRGPVMSVTIVTNPASDRSRRIPLWIQKREDRSALADMPFVTEVRVGLNIGYLPTISVTLCPTFSQAIAFINSPLIEWGQSALEVQFGYANGPQGPVLSPVFSGIMLKPEVSIDQEVSISLKAQGLGGLSAARQGGAREFSKMTRLDIIQQVALGPDPLNPRLLDVDASEVTPASGDSYKLLKQDRITDSQGTLTDWTTIWRHVRAAKCWMSLIGAGCRTLKIFPRDQSMAQSPKYTLMLGDYPEGRIGMDVGVLPILSFSSPSMAVYLPGASRGIFVGGVSPETKKIFGELVNEKSDPVQRTGPARGSAAPAATRIMPGANAQTGAGAGRLIAADDPNAARAQAAEEFQAVSAATMGLPATVTTLGVPDLYPADVILVKGVGARLEGNYGVFNVEHVVGSDGYSTTLDLRSNLSPAVLGPAPENTAPSGAVNTAVPAKRTPGKVIKKFEKEGD